ncbi:Mu transposase C-terminal domain-containing protein [Pseudomonas sp. 18.1.10]|uniref:Mu transposase C-terminal domain-containing protein n=1 Tax=Pseudomonas sp. 18.1.10 TaxID=2969302 RepID=UPI0035B0CB2B
MKSKEQTRLVTHNGIQFCGQQYTHAPRGSLLPNGVSVRSSPNDLTAIHVTCSGKTHRVATQDNEIV